MSAAAERCRKHRATFGELLAPRDDGDIDNEEVAVPPHLSRPCSAPRMSAGATFNATSSSTSEAALVSELAERGRHTSVEQFADTADACGAFELLSRFQSATTSSHSRVNVEVDYDDDDDDEDDRHQPRRVHGSDSCTYDCRPSDNHDVVYDVYAASADYDCLPSDGAVRWTIAENSAADQVCQNSPDDGEEDLRDDDNELFVDDLLNYDDERTAGSSTSSRDAETRINALLASSSGRHMTSTPMTSLPACCRVVPSDEDFTQCRESAWQRSWSPCVSDGDEDVGAEQVRGRNSETIPGEACSNCDDADVHRQRRRRVVMYYPPQAFKFYMEQHMENVMKAYEERQRHRAQLEDEMERLALSDDARTQMRRMLFQKESYHNRLRRTRMDRSAFRPIAVLGRGAFADVLLVRKRDSEALYAMKRLRKSDVLRNRQAAHVKAERDILAEADNEWIVRLFYSFQVTFSTSYAHSLLTFRRLLKHFYY